MTSNAMDDSLPTRILHAEKACRPVSASAPRLRHVAGNRYAQFCLFLIYYFTLEDFIIKFLPGGIAYFLRYLPEVLLYAGAFFLRNKDRKITQFPLFWPLCVCLASMLVSALLHGASMRMALLDFYSNFRFVTFAYILWNANLSARQLIRFIDDFFVLVILEAMIGALELTGTSAMNFFRPVLGWSNGVAYVSTEQAESSGGWIFGSFSNYNHFGLFMVMSFLLAINMFVMRRANRYLWIAMTSFAAVVFSYSRHSLLILAITVVVSACVHRRKIAQAFRGRNLVLPVAALMMVFVLGGSMLEPVKKRIASVTDSSVLAGEQSENVRLYMILLLTPKFMETFPFFGQGPIDQAEKVSLGESDVSLGPSFKAAPEMPGWATFYAGDVVWLMILGLYGCCGLAAMAFVFCKIFLAARILANLPQNKNPEGVQICANVTMILIGVVVSAGFFSQEIIARDTIPIFWALSGFLLSYAFQYKQYASSSAALCEHTSRRAQA